MALALATFLNEKIQFIRSVFFGIMKQFQEQVGVLFDRSRLAGKAFAIELDRGNHDKVKLQCEALQPVANLQPPRDTGRRRAWVS